MRTILASAVAALLLAPPVAAKEKPPVFVTSNAVKDQPAITLDATRAYILVRGTSTVPIHLMRDPSAQDQMVYDRLRADALAEAKAKYAKRHAAWAKDKAAADALPKGDSRVRPPGPEPAEPTEQNFDFPAFGLMTGVSIGPMNRFAKAQGGASTYLQAITPGSYRLYGPMVVMANGSAAGSCFCMGSVRFEAKAGEIVDLGTFVSEVAGKSAGAGEDKLVPFTFRIEPATEATALDPRLKGMAVHPAAYRPAGKLPNYFGLAINRLEPMPNVFRYDRDKIVDLTAAR